MEPLPSYIGDWVAVLSWPKPNTDGTTTLSREDLGRVSSVLNALVNYLEQQLAACKVE